MGNYLHRHGCPWSPTACVVAAQHGHLEVLQYLFDHQCGCRGELCMSQAIQSGQLKIVQFLHESEGVEQQPDYFTAAGYGQLDILRYLYQIYGPDCRWDRGSEWS